MNRVVCDANVREVPAYAPSVDLRKPAAAASVLVDIKHVPEHYDICINGYSIDKYSDEELFDLIAAIEAEMAKLEQIVNKPMALARFLDEKSTSINRICAWMNSRKEVASKPAAPSGC